MRPGYIKLPETSSDNHAHTLALSYYCKKKGLTLDKNLEGGSVMGYSYFIFLGPSTTYTFMDYMPYDLQEMTIEEFLEEDEVPEDYNYGDMI